MMDGGRVLFDASAYILFEACGDSEIEFFDRTIAGAFEVESDSGAAEDDAQSCSYESLSVSSREHEVDGDDRFFGADFVLFGEDEYRMDKEVSPADIRDEEDGVVDQYRGRCMAAAQREGSPEAAAKEKLKKSNGPEDWTMSEQERGRLFWENCLASNEF